MKTVQITNSARANTLLIVHSTNNKLGLKSLAHFTVSLQLVEMCADSVQSTWSTPECVQCLEMHSRRFNFSLFNNLQQQQVQARQGIA